MSSKLHEKLMYKRLYSFSTKNKIIYSLQLDCQNNHSIDHVSISMTEAIKSTIDNRKYGCGICIDLQKTCDTANHDILICKLEHCGTRGNVFAWFTGYLSDRYQFVAVDDRNSESSKVTSSVPQGSVLGTSLFLLFINDLPNVSKKLTFYLFVDDTNIYYESETVTILVKRASTVLNVQKWLDANQLSINTSETNYIMGHFNQSW